MADMKAIVKRVGIVADRLVPPPPGITILIYHRVGGQSDSDVDLSPETFERHLEYLSENHRVLSMAEAVAELAEGTNNGWVTDPSSADKSAATNEAAQRGVVITFDDGTEDFTDLVVPALDRHGLPATLYLATRFIDESVEFPWGAPPTSWAALRDSLAGGYVTIGSHTHTHCLLDRLDTSLIAEDLDRSIELIQDNLELSPQHFAYPKAMPGSPAAEIAVRRRFDTASLAKSRVNRPGATDLHRLWRTPIQRSDDFDMFTLKAAGGLRLEGELRSLAARARYRGIDR